MNGSRGTFLLALAAVCLVAVVDAATGARAILVEFLIIGPLIAAMRASVAQTAVVALVALILAVPIGLASDAFGSTEHVTGVIVVGVVGALAVVIARLRERRERNAARLAAQYGVARVLADAESVEASATELLQAIGEPLEWELGHLWEVRGESLESVGAWAAPGVHAPEFEEATRSLRVRSGVGFAGHVWESGNAIFLADAVKAGNFKRAEAARRSGIRDGVAFPVVSGERRLAVIELFSRRPAHPQPDMLEVTTALGVLIGEFMERVRTGHERDELLALEELASLNARDARDQLEAILSGVADAVTAQAPDGRLLFANQAAVELLGFDSQEALLQAPVAEIMARYEILTEQGEPFDAAQLPGRRALTEGEPGQATVRFRERGSGDERWSTIKAAPIRGDGGEVRMAINVIEDITAHKRAENAQRFLSESSAVLTTSLDPETVMGEIARLAVPTMADWLFIDLALDGVRIDRVAVAHTDPERLQDAERLYRSTRPSQDAPKGVPNVLRTARSELHRDLQEVIEAGAGGGPPYFRLARALGMRSAIVVPMTSRGRTLGALTLATDSDGRCFDEQDLEVAEELARRCATAIDNARLFSERAHIARTLQQSLLPAELPEIPGVEAAARFRPTGEGNEVGGDFYDLFESGPQGWSIVMGDVCGKGPDAAAVTALARYTLRAAAMREQSPSRSLEVLNEALLRQRDDRRFCTVAYVQLDLADQQARVGCAVGGHPLPLLLRRDGGVEAVGAPGSLLGIYPDPDIEDRSTSLHPGDALVFFTDGVIEDRGPDGTLDEAGLVHLLAACAGEGADAIAARVEDAAVKASGGTPRDDIAVLVLRVAG